jgi:hypothetical protein
MTNDWSFRDEILSATQHWPWLALFCLLGCLSGWAISLIWPTPHRATTELYVGLNVYRSSEDANASAYAGIELVNANDYKNWQMASLNSLTSMDEVIQKTLHQLQEADPYWQKVDPAQLGKSLHVYWRNAGKWRLVAENEDPQHASRAVTVWQDVVLEHVQAAVSESQRAMVLEFQLKSIAEAQSQIITGTETLKRTHTDLANWSDSLAQQAPDLPLESTERWQLWRSISRNNLDASWTPLLEAFPTPQASARDYSVWVEQVTPALEETIQFRSKQLEDLNAQASEVKRQFSAASQKSRGLSATLDVEKISGARTEHSIIRPTGILVLVGSIIGLVAWLIQWFAGISLRGKV